MKIEIENGKLALAINFMYGLKLARKQSRFRRHFIHQMTDRLKQVDEDRQALLEEHSHKDEEGKAIMKDGNYHVKDMIAFSNDLKELNKEKFIVDGGDNQEMITTIKVVLENLENEEYEGQDSEIYDYLCDQFQLEGEEQ
ncbi:hypothetical protein MCZ05_01810 [Bacillus safensis]|uniref:hypothetical protein n=1 Tax=Bacillus safensis TaxID=561879 RepID=UPI002281C3DC|nr:hypothetical protein [Bacillus safensis]MCY7468155.1 hypothetical protein [Bacillus safensis]